METRKQARMRRAQQTRRRISLAKASRLTVYRSNNHIYAAVHSFDGAKVLASASTVDAEIKAACGNTGSNKAAAKVVGEFVAKRALAAGVKEVAFDRAGFAYHGRVKELADAAREAGLSF